MSPRLALLGVVQVPLPEVELARGELGEARGELGEAARTSTA